MYNNYAKIAETDKKLTELPSLIDAQRSRLKASVKHLAALHKTLKPIAGSDADDRRAIEEVNQVRLQAISAIQKFLG